MEICLELSVPVRLPPRVIVIWSPEISRFRPSVPPPAVTCKLENLLIEPVVSREPPSKRRVSFPVPKSISPSPSKIAPSSRISSFAPKERVGLEARFVRITLLCALPVIRTRSFPLPVSIGAFKVELFNTRVSLPEPRKKDRFSACASIVESVIVTVSSPSLVKISPAGEFKLITALLISRRSSLAVNS